MEGAMKRVVGVAGCLGTLLLLCATSCSGGFSCDLTHPCPKGTFDAAWRQSCKTEQASKCGAQFNTYMNCALGAQKCAADGTLDSAATQTALAGCAQQSAAYLNCKGNPG
jgi:hypothetical protein